MIDGDRCFKTMHGYDVVFSETSNVVISGEDDGGEFEIQLDPTDLSLIYGAYMQMCTENIKEEEIRRNTK